MSLVLSVRKVLMVSACGAALVWCSQAAQAGFEWTPPSKPVAPPAAYVETPATAASIDPNFLTPEPDAALTAPIAPVEGAALKPEDLVVPDTSIAPAQTAPEGLRVVQTTAPKSIAAPTPIQEPVGGMKTIASREAVKASAQPEQISSVPRRQPERIQWNEGQSQSKEASQVSAAPQAVAPTPAPKMLAPASPLADAKVVEGFAKDISLALALSQVVPPNYAYKFANDVNAGQKVSWNGGKPWPQVLSDMLTGSDLQVVILGNTVTVERVGGASAAQMQKPLPLKDVDEVAAEPVASPSTETKVARLSQDDAASLPVPVRSVSLAQQASEAQAAEANERNVAASSAAPVATVATAAPSAKGAPVVDIQTSRRWEANPGKTLRETLEGWSATAGADIEWMSPYDYPVDHAFVYEGKFDAAVDSILSLYSREQQRPRGKLYPNLPTGPSVLMIN